MAAAEAIRTAEHPDFGSSGPDDSDDGAAVLTGDSADESSNQTDSGGAAPASNRRKIYKRTSSLEHKASEGFSTDLNQRPPVRRRILRKDRRATLEMLTSDDDVNAYQATRPSSYLEPAARRSLHESAPHLKSSFETLYNPELMHMQVASEQISSSSSESPGSEADKTLRIDTWQLASGPKVSSTYLHTYVQRRPALGTPDQTDQKDERVHNGSKVYTQKLEVTSGKIWTEFGGQSPAAVDRNWASNLQSGAMSQPLNLSIRVSQPSLQVSKVSPTHSNDSVGVDVEIELSRSISSTVASTLQLSAVQMTETGRSKEQIQRTNSELSVKQPLLPDKPTMPIRGRRVLPAVPDSADLEVSDLLRVDAVAKSESTTLENRPKSAVEILVAKDRCSSIQQLQSSSVSQQLRSLFHNPSPHIMLHRAATQQTQPQPPRTVRAETSSSVELGKGNNKYTPLRASHGSHQPQNMQQLPNGRQSAFEILMSKQNLISSNPFTPTLQQPPEIPRRQNKGYFLPPNQSFHQEASCTIVSSPSVSSNVSSSNLGAQMTFRLSDSKFNSEQYQARQQHAISCQTNNVFGHEHFGQQELLRRIPIDTHLPVSTVSTTCSIATDPVEPNHASFNAVPMKNIFSSVSNHTVAQAPPLPPRRAKQVGQAHPQSIVYSSQSQHVTEQSNKRSPLKTEQHQVVLNYKLKAPAHEDTAGSGEDDSGCCQSSGEYLLARETTAVAALSQANPTRIQTNPRTGRAGTMLDADRRLPPRGVQLPPNAVRVLPSSESVNIDELRRVLAVRRERAAAAATFHSAERAEDAIAGLEQMCREMRLHDDQLLDGAERRDTAIRVQARLDAIRSLQGEPVHHLQRIAIPNSIFGSMSNRSYIAQTDSSLRLESSSAAVTAPRTDSVLHLSGSKQSNLQFQSTERTLLPGEEESGPEIIL